MFEPIRGLQPLEVGALAFAAVYLSTWIHECGHAVAGKISGFRITSVGIGFGAPLLRWQLGDTVFFISLRRPFQGITTSVRDSWPTKKSAKATLLLGGLGANLVFAGLAYGGYRFLPDLSAWFSLLALVNAAFAILSLLPANIALPGVALKTDASQVLTLFFGKKKPRERFVGVHDAERFVAFLSAVEDRYGEFHYRIHLASNLTVIGHPRRALEVLENVQEDLYPERSHMGALLRVVRGSALMAAGTREDGLKDLETGASFFQEVGAPSMTPHLQLLKARADLDEGRLEETRAELEGMEGDSQSRFESLVRAEYRVRSGDFEGAIETLGQLEWGQGEEALEATGIELEALGRLGKHADALERGVPAARRVLVNLVSLSRPEDREAYLIKHQRIMDGVPANFEALNRRQDAEAFREELAHTRTARTAVARAVSLTGLSAVVCSFLAAVFLVLAIRAVGRFEPGLHFLRWATILGFAGLYFSVSGLLNRRIHKALPILGGVLSGVTLVVLGTFFLTIFLTRRGVHREILEYDLDGDGRVDRVVIFMRGVRVREGWDEDGDGEIDRWVDHRREDPAGGK
ncbi:MAG: site-2 protease family protein [Planctomycetota bacterium]|jgi:hypothetical protein